jgi:hypothetical protein
MYALSKPGRDLTPLHFTKYFAAEVENHHYF